MARPPILPYDDTPLAQAHLTSASLALLGAIRARERGSIREWQAVLGWSTTSVVEYHMHQLRRAGLIAWRSGTARSVVLLDGVGAAPCERCVRLEAALRAIQSGVTPANAAPECVVRIQELVEEVLG